MTTTVTTTTTTPSYDSREDFSKTHFYRNQSTYKTPHRIAALRRSHIIAKILLRFHVPPTRTHFIEMLGYYQLTPLSCRHEQELKVTPVGFPATVRGARMVMNTTSTATTTIPYRCFSWWTFRIHFRGNRATQQNHQSRRSIAN
jgi:hypothetical protein